MDSTLAGTLPGQVPEVMNYYHQPTDSLPFAVYTLYECGDSHLEQLCNACLSQVPAQERAGILLPPQQHTFKNDSLRPVMDYHIQLGVAGTHDPIYFVVASSDSWNSDGVLLATLDSGDGHGKPGLFRVRAKHAGLLLVNLQNGNLEWEEQKECYDFDLDVHEERRAAYEAEGCGTPGSQDHDETMMGTCPTLSERRIADEASLG